MYQICHQLDDPRYFKTHMPKTKLINSCSLDHTSIIYWQAIEQFQSSISLFMSIKNCEHSKMLPCLQTSKLACHSFMIAGKRYKTLGSEMKVSIKFDQELQREKKLNWG